MKESVNKSRGERGFTLIELISALSLLSLVGGLIFTVILYGMNTYGKIETENSLRDDADLLMSSVINELYSYAPDFISADGNGIKLKTDSEEKLIYMRDKKLHIGTRIVDTQSDVLIEGETGVQTSSGSSISLKCSTTADKCSSGLITIKLVLEQDHNRHNQQLTLESKFGF